MKIFVTGAAGFIGSHLCEKLLIDSSHEVIGIDAFIGPTPEKIKQMNLVNLSNHPRFTLIRGDLMTVNLDELLKGIDIIYHLAAIPGVRSSWGKEFGPYVTNNIFVTQRLLEAVKDKDIKKFIYASTSSVYGNTDGKVTENENMSPLSPYGITKLTAEQLCKVYHKNFQIPIVTVRFFTVYGPRQRPDMAFHRFIKQILKEEPLTVYGNGTQSRDFTYIKDCIEGTAAVLHKDHCIGQTINIGGKERSTVNEVISILEELTGKKARKNYLPKLIGESEHTWADISNANKLLDYNPKIYLREGLVEEIAYISSLYSL